jgi:hypothetical protein
MAWGEAAQMITAIAAVGSMLASLRNARKIDQVHQATDGIVERLVTSAKAEAHAAGVKEGESH